MCVHAVPPLWLLTILKSKLGDDLIDFFPRKFNLNFLFLLGIVIEKGTDINPETPFLQNF